MANKVTGSTDTTGALSVTSASNKCVMVIGEMKGAELEVINTTANTIFSINGTNDVATKFGTLSPLIEMVKILITNGVSNIKGIAVAEYGVALPHLTIASAYSAALDVSLGDKTVKCVLCDTNDATVITAVNTHLTTAESNDLFRYSVFAPDSANTTQAGLITFATTNGSDRIFIPGPAVVNESAIVHTSGVYAMAGLTAVIMTETSDPALPMNGVVIKGLGGVDRSVLEIERTALADAGITVLYADGNYPAIHRLVTSYTTDTIWQEGTTRFIADDVLDSVENALRTNYKRTKNVSRVIDSIKTTVKTVLEEKEGLEIIEDFDPTLISVIKDPTNNFGALVDYTFDVVTPLYTITINQHMKI